MADRERTTARAAAQYDTNTAVEIVADISEFLRAEWLEGKTFEGWPFLPTQRGKQPTAAQANAFFLGCCINYHQLTRTAWRKADEFCRTHVGLANRERLWSWIARHSRHDWESRWAECGYLHPTPARHRKLYDIAMILRDRYRDDARELWRKENVGRLVEVLEDQLAIGPALTRMVIGALRDHRLITLKSSDVKPDIHVVRLMNAMGLSKTTKAVQVAADARRWFPKDPWVADLALYTLGASYGARTRADVLRIYRAILDWRTVHPTLKRSLKGMVDDLKLASDGVLRFYPDSSLHWAGFDLVEIRGGLKKAMYDDETLWAWVGFGFDGKLVSAPTIAGSPEHFTPAVKAVLRDASFVEDVTGAEARRGNVEYYAERAVDRERLRRPVLLKEAVLKQIMMLRGVLEVIERRAHVQSRGRAI